MVYRICTVISRDCDCDDAERRPDTELRYVPHESVEQFAAEGWVATEGLTGTHHGHYAVLMLRPAHACTDRLPGIPEYPRRTRAP